MHLGFVFFEYYIGNVTASNFFTLCILIVANNIGIPRKINGCIRQVDTVFVILHSVFFYFCTILIDVSVYIFESISAAFKRRSNLCTGVYKIAFIRVIDTVETVRVNDSHLRVAFGYFLLNDLRRKREPVLPLRASVRNVSHYPAFAFYILDGTPISCRRITDYPSRLILLHLGFALLEGNIRNVSARNGFFIGVRRVKEEIIIISEIVSLIRQINREHISAVSFRKSVDEMQMSILIHPVVAARSVKGNQSRSGFYKTALIGIRIALKVIHVSYNHSRATLIDVMLHYFARNLAIPSFGSRIFNHPTFAFEIGHLAVVARGCKQPFALVFIIELGKLVDRNIQRINVRAFSIDIDISARIFVKIDSEINPMFSVVGIPELLPIVKRYSRILIIEIRFAVGCNHYGFDLTRIVGKPGSGICCGERKSCISQLFQLGKNISGNHGVNGTHVGRRYAILTLFNIYGNGSGNGLRRNEKLFNVLVAVRADAVFAERMFGGDFFAFLIAAYATNSFF